MKDPELVGATKPLSKTLGFNPCSGGVCGPPAVRPLVDTGAMVFVVFGILGVNRTQRTDNHVIGDTVRVAAQPLEPQNQIHERILLARRLISPSALLSAGPGDIGSRL